MAQDLYQFHKKRLRHILGPLLAVCFLVYFIYHIFQGERGVIAWLRLQKKVDESERVLRDLENQKETLERQVYLLRPDSLDKDMLEERVRVVLNFARSDEIIVHDDDIIGNSEKKSAAQTRL